MKPGETFAYAAWHRAESPLCQCNGKGFCKRWWNAIQKWASYYATNPQR